MTAPLMSIAPNPEHQRVEARTDTGQLAGFAQYADHGKVLVFFHTEVDDGYAGQGVGSQIARGVFDWVAAEGRRIDPTCPFLNAWVQKNTEFASLLIRS